METSHQIVFSDSRQMDTVPSVSADLLVTSPPYPMIKMWDKLFAAQDQEIGQSLRQHDGWRAFELMHQQLDPVWQESFRVIKPGGIACINIGDATRTISGNFVLFPNHSRILAALTEVGFKPLTLILWRKQTNAPNKFMGSGMLPPGAYVTLEHEYILIVRKGTKREFKTEGDKQLRRSSAYFWEERNVWFSDMWIDLKGVRQSLISATERKRSAAFPFELPYRLINMFSVKGDIVLDPFWGTGTTTWAAVAAARSSVGFELDSGFNGLYHSNLDNILQISNNRLQTRINNHAKFVTERQKANKALKYMNRHYQLPVVTRQETELLLNPLSAVKKTKDDQIVAVYRDRPDYVFDDGCYEIVNLKPKQRVKSQRDLI